MIICIIKIVFPTPHIEIFDKKISKEFWAELDLICEVKEAH